MLDALGFDLDGPLITEQTPAADARFDTLIALIERLLREPAGATETARPETTPAQPGATAARPSGGTAQDGNGTTVDNGSSTAGEGAFRPDERLIVFTEYKTTLDYLARRLRERYPADRVLTLFGSGGPEGMDESGREHVKAAFNDPATPVRVLVATDAASEGLNLHRTARYLLHYDCPWNPSRLEQRNGRIDRYGQARDVTVHHFVSTTDPDLRFLDHVIRKADEIREDLGSVNDVFDRAAHRRLVRGEDAASVQADLDRGIATTRGGTVLDADATVAAAPAEAREAAVIETMATEIDLDPRSLRDTLEAALAIPAGRPQLQADAEPGFSRVLHPDLAGWRDVIDEAVRRPVPSGGHGPLPRLAFSTEPFIERLGSLSVFRPRPDALLMHLAHPLMQRALGVLARSRYPGAGGETSRWTVRLGAVPAGADAVVLLSIEELGVNELRETFHRWVRTLALPVRDGLPGEPLAHAPAAALRGARDTIDPHDRERAADLFEDVRARLQEWLRRYRDELTERLRGRLRVDGDAARTREDERYRQRQGEVSALIEQSTLARLAREIDSLTRKTTQRGLFDDDERLADLERSIDEKQEELTRRRRHYEEIREQLQRERARILDHLLPARFTLAGRVQVFPVAVEIRLPERSH